MDLNQTQVPASRGSFIERRKLDLIPNRTASVNVYGRVFYCNAATGPFEMNFNDGEFFPIVGRGVEWALVGDDRYSRLQFRALAESTSIEFYAGNFAFHENVITVASIASVTQKVAKTRVRWGPFAIEAGHSIPLLGNGAVGSGYGYRKSLIVTNLDPDLDLHLYNLLPANPVAMIFPRQANVWETSADIFLYNPNPTTMAIRIMEIFYLE